MSNNTNTSTSNSSNTYRIAQAISAALSRKAGRWVVEMLKEAVYPPRYTASGGYTVLPDVPVERWDFAGRRLAPGGIDLPPGQIVKMVDGAIFARCPGPDFAIDDEGYVRLAVDEYRRISIGDRWVQPVFLYGEQRIEVYDGVNRHLCNTVEEAAKCLGCRRHLRR